MGVGSTYSLTNNMIPPITIVVADDMGQGKEVMTSCKLDMDSCAVITQPSYLDHVTLYPNETVYAHSSTSTDMLNRLNREIKLKAYKNINIKMVTP